MSVDRSILRQLWRVHRQWPNEPHRLDRSLGHHIAQRLRADPRVNPAPSASHADRELKALRALLDNQAMQQASPNWIVFLHSRIADHPDV
jgi:hypothetical protein